MSTSLHRSALLGSLLVTACAQPERTPVVAALRVEPLAAPLDSLAVSPAVAATDDGLLLVWQVPQTDSTWRLRFSRWSANGRWSVVRDGPLDSLMQAGRADPPQLFAQSDSVLTAVWTRRQPHLASGRHGYDLATAASTNGGRTWSTPTLAHHDGTATEHGFPSFASLPSGPVMVWVDGRGNAAADTSAQATQLAVAPITADGRLQAESMLDPRICDCCHTSSARVPGGAVVAYRDRHAGEIRDISVLRFTAGAWRAPVTVHADGWQIAGCPVNGPAVAARGSLVAVAWYTGARDTTRVRLAVSRDTATTFGAPIEISDGPADGRVGLVLLDDARAIVSWVERRGAASVLRARAVQLDGTAGPASDVAQLGEQRRAGGMPRLAPMPGGALLAWTEDGTRQVRLARLSAD